MEEERANLSDVLPMKKWMVAFAIQSARPDIRASAPFVGKTARQASETMALSAPSPNRTTPEPDIRGNSVIRLSISTLGRGRGAKPTTVRATAIAAAISGIRNVA